MKTLARQFAGQFLIVAGLWTLIALCTGLADLAFLRLVGRSTPVFDVLRRPLTEHWIWAALTPLVFALVRRFPLAPLQRARAFGLHVLFFVLLSMLHCVIAQGVGSPLAAVPPNYQGSLLVLRFLEEFYSDLWMYWPLVGVRALLDAHAAERERALQASQLGQLMADLQLSLLRAQIQPHFLFNTLHAISALLRVDPRAAEDMLADLAELLRASFDNPTHETSLRHEIAIVDCYLRIQQRRLGERLTLVRHIDPEVLDAAVPTLVLQSLVENAVVHGLAPVNRPGRLEITARREAEHLLLAVRDDGSGLPAAPRQGVGLANARERLRQLYGEAHSFKIGGQPGAGTWVDLRLPFRSMADAA